MLRLGRSDSIAADERLLPINPSLQLMVKALLTQTKLKAQQPNHMIDNSNVQHAASE